ncbi:acetoin dehydrogenase-like protein [Pseudohyphozyma bogoriensis]|nr:acetoin dehydrogenase-like protein [Pseudohyphozyma bogoriensis]
MSTRSPIVDKVALVTGSSRGIGLAIALRLANDGYDVAINDIAANQAGIDAAVKQIEALGRRSVGVVADVSSSDETDAMVAKVVAALGKLDTAVANAGIAEVKVTLDASPILETTEADRKRMLDVNIHGVFNTYISAAKQMVKQGHGGRILGAASIVAFNTFPMLSTYSASKWAVKGFTQASAKEWAKYGIRVNAYAPGIVDTPMWDLIDRELGKHMGLAKGEARKKYVDDLIILGRVSVPDDVAKLVSFLASEDAEYITGQTMITDGGTAFA